MMASTNSYISLGNVIVAKPSWPSLLFVTRAVDKRHSVTKEYLTVETHAMRDVYGGHFSKVMLKGCFCDISE